jgi:hypothetical protein
MITSQAHTVFEKSGIEHLHGDLYRVPSKDLKFADGVLNDSCSFVNPRHISGGIGFDKDQMNQLTEAIRTEGLLHPLIAMTDDKNNLLIISGERRKRAIDRLIGDNAMVHDRVSGKMVPAKELYTMIPCTIMVKPDAKVAYKFATSVNEGSVPVGDAATVALIRQWKRWGWRDEDICSATNKSITWLKDCYKIIGLDEVCWSAFLSRKINRTVALRLADIADVEKRVSVLTAGVYIAQTRVENLKPEAKKPEKKVMSGIDMDKAIASVKGKLQKKLTASKLRKLWLPHLNKMSVSPDEKISSNAILVMKVLKAIDDGKENICEVMGASNGN